MTTINPTGTSRFGRVVASNVITTGSIRNISSGVKLGNVHASNTFLVATSNTNGIHLTEAQGTTVWLDTPTIVTQPLFANAGITTTSLQTASASIQGGLTAQFLVSQTSITTNTFTASSSTVSGTSFFQGAASFQSTVSVIGGATFSSSLSAQATTLQSLQVAAASNLNSVTANTLTVAQASINSLTANVANASVLNLGAGSLTYDTSNVGFENLRVSVGGSPALRLYNNDQRALFPGGVITNSVKAQAGQQLVLQPQDAGGSVVVAGNLFVQGATTTVDVQSLQVDDRVIVVARSNTAGPDADVIASGAGLAVEIGTSNYQRSLLWNYNQGGSSYVPNQAGQKSSDFNSYWELSGGNLQITRAIPAAAHIGFSFASNTYVADSTATRVSYRFAIGDDETLNIEKVQGTNLSTGSSTAIGSTSIPVGTFEISPPLP